MLQVHTGVYQVVSVGQYQLQIYQSGFSIYSLDYEELQRAEIKEI